MATIQELLKPSNVQIIDSVSGWMEAVQVAVEPLIEQGYVEARYVDAIINAAIDLGPYFVLCPEVAMPHARPEQGVISSQIAVTLMRKPVRFKEAGPDVRLIVALAAEDSDGHLDALRQLAHVLGKDGRIAALVSAQSPEELYNLLCEE